MGGRLGIIAGSGKFVPHAVAKMRREGLFCVVAGIEGEAEPRLRASSGVFAWIKPGEVRRAISFFKKHRVSRVTMLGKIRPGFLFKRENFDSDARLLWEKIGEKSPTAVLSAVIAFLEEHRLRVIRPVSFWRSFFCQDGLLTAAAPSVRLLEDIDFGLRVAKDIADMEIGQTVIVKEKAVVAVEGMEGTDLAIKRGGQLAGCGFVAVKVSRTLQDLRMDVPAVGLDTVKTLVRAGGAALGIEASRVAFFEREKAVALADAHGVAIVARRI